MNNFYVISRQVLTKKKTKQLKGISRLMALSGFTVPSDHNLQSPVDAQIRNHVECNETTGEM